MTFLMQHAGGIAVRSVDLRRPLADLADVDCYSGTRVYVMLDDRPIGHVDIANQYQPISAMHLRSVIAAELQDAVVQALAETQPPPLAPSVTASVIVATYDRPNDLRNCLSRLSGQRPMRRVEIVVVDNHPASGLTPPVVAEFPGVVLVSEMRQGLAYARNAGFSAANGDIVVCTDDDVTVSANWLERILAQFARPEVMAVTGNVFPLELDTPAQRLFELYGGLGRGFRRREVGADWFHGQRMAVPTWKLGATANAAFRMTIFSHPQIGLMDESLGPGMPSGIGEDTYLFYKILRAGYQLVYEPSAYVWHRHRREMPALRRQLRAYSTGHVAYHLTTLFNDGDLRALIRLGYELPKGYLWYIKQRLHSRYAYPLSLVWIEAISALAGPSALWRSRRRVRREGRSSTIVPRRLWPGAVD